VNKTRLYNLASRMNIALDEKQLNTFEKYYKMLIEKNKVMNLTAITEWEDVCVKHFADSLSIVKCMDMTKVRTVMDLGTGAGFPGIPLKIAFPHLNITLADSLGKRIRFLEEVIEQCALDDVTAVHARAEDIAKDPEYREKYDLCVSRAVANLSTLCEYCLPFVHKGGSFVSYKSGKAREEIDFSRHAVKVLGGGLITEKDITEFVLPDTDMERVLVRIKKVTSTPAKYPRKAGIPAKEPL